MLSRLLDLAMLRASLRRFSVVYHLAAVYLLAGVLLRLVLWARFGRNADVALSSLAWILPAGVLNDLVTVAYLLLPTTLFIAVTPDHWHRGRALSIVIALGSIVAISALVFVSASEYFFFEEFDARFNLVAFDYLMYPTEIIGDIRAEYPVGPILGAAVFVGLTVFWVLRRRMLVSAQTVIRLRARLLPVAGQLSIVGVAAMFVATDSLGWSSNRVANKLAADGASSFFRAARTSEISYEAYYATHERSDNRATLKSHFAHGDGTVRQTADGELARHYAADARGLGKLNVVVIAEESFGAEFSQLYGSSQGLTPNFDEFAAKSIWFQHAYASGTRTVRGLEAIAASFPPIPSVSILRRPHNEHIATWGSVMRKQGYHTSFLYGGYGYFDNMSYFFGNNGYDVVDRTTIENVRFANMWGGERRRLVRPRARLLRRTPRERTAVLLDSYDHIQSQTVYVSPRRTRGARIRRWPRGRRALC